MWIHAYTEWKEWFDKWKGKREPGWFGARERRTKPDPPAWLAEYCRVTPVPDGDFAIGCELLADWREDPVAAAIKEKIRSERANREAQTRTRWWSQVHIDALWLTPQVPASYGVIGVHLALKVAGRFHLFAAPGAMLLNLPARDGTREWKPATISVSATRSPISSSPDMHAPRRCISTSRRPGSWEAAARWSIRAST